jgi:polyisoprenoid-binding protein YceI
MTGFALTALAALALAGSTPGPAACDSGDVRLSADLQRSLIEWKGTKFWGLGKHEGIVRLKSGELCVREGQISAGTFVADMTSIEVTDIPANDPVPRRRLRDHLMSEDFFHVAAYPEARLALTAVQREDHSLHRVTALLTIRGRTHRIEFFARVWALNDTAVSAEAHLELDRHRWNVSYVGSTLRDDLVDDDFVLDLKLAAHATGSN